jgi:RNA polymerase sigma-70 factor (ECF subfamily)
VEPAIAAVRVAGQPVEDLFREVAPRLWHTVLAYAGGRRDIADDAVSEAFARAIEHGGVVRNPAPWLYRVALNIAARELKRGARLTPLDGVDESGPTIEQGGVAEMLQSLSPGQRAAVYLHYQEDLPIKEVARLMGTSVAVVKVHLYRGRARLRASLGGEDDA